MTEQERREAIKRFIDKWKDKGQEDEDARSFWIELLQDLLSVSHVTDRVDFEKKVTEGGSTKRIDVYIPETRVLIEQKSKGIALDKQQTGHGGKTPYRQAKEYDNALKVSEKAKWIVLSNFEEIWVYNMDSKNPEANPEIIRITDLGKDLHHLEFLVNEKVTSITRETEISKDAGRIVAKLYNAFAEQYDDLNNKESQKSLNALCVRLVFCLYAEDAGVFGKKNMFHDYLKMFDAPSLRQAIIDLFQILNQKPEERGPYLRAELAAFPYVNGGLFSDIHMEIPFVTEEIRTLLLQEASDFNWSSISPTIFGAVFESTLNPDTRHENGMHYTSIENIHKVIDPLFFNELLDEFDGIIYENLSRIKELREEERKKREELSERREKASSIKDSQKRKLVLDQIIKDEKDFFKKQGARTRRKNTTVDERLKELEALHEKISKLTFLDPACGSGNFLTESYLSLRKLENKIIEEKQNVLLQHSGNDNVYDQISFGLDGGVQGSPIRVSIDQFYGIEINDFAVAVATTALWIAESQMIKETEDIVHQPITYLPLKPYTNIVEGNALDIEWNDVIHKNRLNYIMGNPPFVGATNCKEEQKADIVSLFGKIKLSNSIDYVGGWYYKAVEFIQGTSIKCAFVSTNSITQGEQVAPLWGTLLDRFRLSINFAYKTFIWTSEAKKKASVHCVIIGFSSIEDDNKVIFDQGEVCGVESISPYLIDSPMILVSSRSKPICNVPQMFLGNKPADGGNLILSVEEKDNVIKKDPELSRYIRQYVGAEEFVKGKHRYCFWLQNASPAELRAHNELKKRIAAVKQMRLESTAKPTRDKASSPHLFFFVSQPNSGNYILVPSTTSLNRDYIPIGFMSHEVIASNAATIIPDAELFHFGILESDVHMAWMRTVAGRLKSDYRYSNNIVYNNFPWPELSENHKEIINLTAQAILDARVLFPDSSLADLYDPTTMPIELRRAHKANDVAVRTAYGFDTDMMEEDIAVLLLKKYQNLID